MDFCLFIWYTTANAAENNKVCSSNQCKSIIQKNKERTELNRTQPNKMMFESGFSFVINKTHTHKRENTQYEYGSKS